MTMMLMILEIALFTLIGISTLDRYGIVLAQTNVKEAIVLLNYLKWAF